MVDGAFDPLHQGHVEYFNRAREIGGALLCNIAPEAHPVLNLMLMPDQFDVGERVLMEACRDHGALPRNFPPSRRWPTSEELDSCELDSELGEPEAIDWLESNGIKHELLDVSKNVEARDEMHELTGQTRTPTIDVDGQVLTDFDADELEAWWENAGFSV